MNTITGVTSGKTWSPKSEILGILEQTIGWLGGTMIRASDLRSSGHGFDSQLGRYQVTTLGKLFTPTCLCHQAV